MRGLGRQISKLGVILGTAAFIAAVYWLSQRLLDFGWQRVILILVPLVLLWPVNLTIENIFHHFRRFGWSYFLIFCLSLTVNFSSLQILTILGFLFEYARSSSVQMRTRFGLVVAFIAMLPLEYFVNYSLGFVIRNVYATGIGFIVKLLEPETILQGTQIITGTNIATVDLNCAGIATIFLLGYFVSIYCSLMRHSGLKTLAYLSGVVFIFLVLNFAHLLGLAISQNLLNIPGLFELHRQLNYLLAGVSVVLGLLVFPFLGRQLFANSFNQLRELAAKFKALRNSKVPQRRLSQMLLALNTFLTILLVVAIAWIAYSRAQTLNCNDFSYLQYSQELAPNLKTLTSQLNILPAQICSNSEKPSTVYFISADSRIFSNLNLLGFGRSVSQRVIYDKDDNTSLELTFTDSKINFHAESCGQRTGELATFLSWRLDNFCPNLFVLEVREEKVK
jgi:exosortase/archaeosortase family protein